MDDWIHFLPERHRKSVFFKRKIRQLLPDFKKPKSLAVLVVLVQLCLAITVGLWSGSLSISALAVAPLVLVPPLALLAYWLTWNDFHR